MDAFPFFILNEIPIMLDVFNLSTSSYNYTDSKDTLDKNRTTKSKF